MGSGSEKSGNSWWSKALWGPAAGYFQKKIGIFQGSANPHHVPQTQQDSPADAERRRRRGASAGRSTVLTGALGPAASKSSILGGM